MVWWINTTKSKWSVGTCFDFRSVPEIIYQTVNIMFDCHDLSISGFDYYILMNKGINIFNVDLTKHKMKFFNDIKNVLLNAEEITKTYVSIPYRPVGLSVTMSIKNPIEIDDRVDIIILKDITKTEEVFEFRKQNKKFSSIPILLWPQIYKIEDINELIKMSDGIILDTNFTDSLCETINVLRIAKEVYKPVFHFESNMVQEYHDNNSTSQNRRILIYAKHIVSYVIDGVIIADCIGKPPTALIQSLIKAVEIAQYDVHPDKEYFKRSWQVQPPMLPPMSAAFGACLAALKCRAAAIVVLTTSGASVKVVSNTAPPSHILAVTAHETTARQMHLYKNVIPVYYNEKYAASWQQECRARVVFGIRFGLTIGIFSLAAKLVVLTPHEDTACYCNSFQIVKASDIINESSYRSNSKVVLCAT